MGQPTNPAFRSLFQESLLRFEHTSLGSGQCNPASVIQIPGLALRVTGLPQLDQMLGGGLYCNSSVLISGNTGTGEAILIDNLLCEAGPQWRA